MKTINRIVYIAKSKGDQSNNNKTKNSNKSTKSSVSKFNILNYILQ